MKPSNRGLAPVSNRRTRRICHGRIRPAGRVGSPGRITGSDHRVGSPGPVAGPVRQIQPIWGQACSRSGVGGAAGGTRTLTGFRPLVPETSLSTNFSTAAAPPRGRGPARGAVYRSCPAITTDNRRFPIPTDPLSSGRRLRFTAVPRGPERPLRRCGAGLARPVAQGIRRGKGNGQSGHWGSVFRAGG